MTTEARDIMSGNCDDMSEGSNKVDLRKNKEKDTLSTQQNAPIKDSSAEEKTQSILASTNLKKLMIDAADVKNPAVQLAAVQQCRQILSCAKNPPIDGIIATGILPILIQCLSRAGNPKLQYESACVLENITSGTSAQIDKVVDAGVVSVLLDLLKSPIHNICKQTLCILHNIVSASCVLRDFVISQGLVKPLLSFIKPDTDVLVLRDVTFVIQKLYRNGEELPPNEVIRDILPHLSTLIMNEDTDILFDIVWVVNFLTSRENYHIQMLIDAGIVPKLVHLLSHKEIKIQTNALSAICNIVSGTEAQTQVVLNCGVFSHIPALLSHQEVKICLLALKSVCNILCANEQQVQVVIDAGLLPRIVEKLANRELEIQKVAWLAVVNFCMKGSKEQIKKIVNSGVIPIICNTLDCKNTEDIDILLHCLLTIWCIAYGGHDHIQMVIDAGVVPKLVPLLSHKEAKVQSAALKAIVSLVSGTEEQTQVVLNCGTLSRFPALLSHQEKEIRELVMQTLCIILDVNKQQMQAVFDAGLLRGVVEGLDKDEPRTRQWAVQAVAELSKHSVEEQTASLVNCGVLPRLCNLLYLSCEDENFLDILKDTVKAIGNIVSCKTHIQRVIGYGIVPKLVSLLSHEEAQVQTGALEALGNLVSGTAEEAQSVMDSGVLSHIPALLYHKETVVCQLTLWFLNTVVIMKQVQAVIDAGLLPKIVEKLAKGDTNTRVQALRAMRSLTASGTEEQVKALIKCDVLPTLCKLFTCDDSQNVDILMKSAWVIGDLLNSDNSQIQVVVGSGIVPKLVEAISHEEFDVKAAALNAIGRIVTVTDAQAQVVSESGALVHFPALLSHRIEKIRSLALWVLLNILLGGEGLVQAVIDAGLLPMFLEKVNDSELHYYKIHIADIICRLIRDSTHKQVAALIDSGVIPTLCNILSCEDTGTIHFALEGLRNILDRPLVDLVTVTRSVEECGGVEKIEELQLHEDEEIYKKAYGILNKYFNRKLMFMLGNKDSQGLSMNKKRRNVLIKLPTADEKSKRSLAATDLKVLLMNANKPVLQLAAVQQCRTLLSVDKKPTTDEIMSTGILPILMQGLSSADNPTLQLESALALTGIAYDTSAQAYKVVYAGAAPVFLQLLESPHEDVCEQALRALGDIIADGAVLRDFLIELGTVKSLLGLIQREKRVSTLRQATRLIRNLSTSGNPPSNKACEEILLSLNTLIMNKDTDILIDSVRTVSGLTEAGGDHRQMVIDSGIVPKLIPLLSHENAEVQSAALKAIGNIVSGTAAQAQVVLESGALVHFPTLLSYQDNEVCEEALLIVHHLLVGFGIDVDAMFGSGLVAKIVDNIAKGNSKVQKLSVQVISKLSSKIIKAQVPLLIDCGLMAQLCKLLDEDTEYQILKDALCITGCFTRAGGDHIQMAIDSGIVPKLIPLLSHENAEVQSAALKAIGNIVSGTAAQAQVVLESGALVHFPALLSHQVPEVCESALYVLYSILGRNVGQIQAVIDAGLLPKIFEKLTKSGQEWEAAWAFNNLIVAGNEQQVATLIGCGAVPQICNLLGCGHKEIIIILLDGLRNMLDKVGENTVKVVNSIQECGGLDKIKQLQDLDHDIIVHRAKYLLKQYHQVKKIQNQKCKVLTDNKEETDQKQRNVSTNHCTDEEEIWKKLASIDLKELVMYATNADNPAMQRAAVEQCKKLLCFEETSPIDDIIAKGILPVLIQNVPGADNPTLQFETGQALKTITCRSESEYSKIVEAGAVPALLELLKSPHENVYREALVALGNIVGEERVIRDSVIEQRLMKPLLGFMKREVPIPVLLEAARVIRKLCMNNDPPPSVDVIREILPQLSDVLILYNEPAILAPIVLAIGSLIDIGGAHTQMVINYVIVPNLITMLSHKEAKVQNAASKAINSVIASIKDQAQVVLERDTLSHFRGVWPRHRSQMPYDFRSEKVGRDVLWFLSNILAGGQRQVQEVIEAGLLTNLMENLDNVTLATQQLAVQVFTNLSRSGTEVQVAELIKCDFVPELCKLLRCNDPGLINDVLECLLTVLGKAGGSTSETAYSIEECGGVHRIEELQLHADVQIYKKAFAILNHYCTRDEDDASLQWARRC